MQIELAQLSDARHVNYVAARQLQVAGCDALEAHTTLIFIKFKYMSRVETLASA